MTRPRVPAGIRDRRSITIELDLGQIADLDAIAATLARLDRSLPNRTRALRWAIRELTARVDPERPPGLGPMTEPPE